MLLFNEWHRYTRGEKNLIAPYPNRSKSYALLITSDALPLSYRKLAVGWAM